MSLYQGIAAVYDQVFPLKPERLAFVRSLCPPGGAFLDIGCATGSLAREMAIAGRRATGVDLDAEMIRIAAQRASGDGKGARFEVLDMLRAGERFRGERFDTIVCLGNVLVHLGDLERIGAFLAGLASLLAPGGRAALQHVCYENLIAGIAPPMPVIESPEVRFTRSSRYEAATHRVSFTTELLLKTTGETRRDETALYPLTVAELEGLVAKAGLKLQARYADFTRRPAGPVQSSHIALLGA